MITYDLIIQTEHFHRTKYLYFIARVVPNQIVGDGVIDLVNPFKEYFYSMNNFEEVNLIH